MEGLWDRIERLTNTSLTTNDGRSFRILAVDRHRVPALTLGLSETGTGATVIPLLRDDIERAFLRQRSGGPGALTRWLPWGKKHDPKQPFIDALVLAVDTASQQ